MAQFENRTRSKADTDPALLLAQWADFDQRKLMLELGLKNYETIHAYLLDNTVTELYENPTLHFYLKNDLQIGNEKDSLLNPYRNINLRDINFENLPVKDFDGFPFSMFSEDADLAQSVSTVFSDEQNFNAAKLNNKKVKGLSFYNSFAAYFESRNTVYDDCNFFQFFAPSIDMRDSIIKNSTLHRACFADYEGGNYSTTVRLPQIINCDVYNSSFVNASPSFYDCEIIKPNLKGELSAIDCRIVEGDNYQIDVQSIDTVLDNVKITAKTPVLVDNPTIKNSDLSSIVIEGDMNLEHLSNVKFNDCVINGTLNSARSDYFVNDVGTSHIRGYYNLEFDNCRITQALSISSIANVSFKGTTFEKGWSSSLRDRIRNVNLSGSNIDDFYTKQQFIDLWDEEISNVIWADGSIING